MCDNIEEASLFKNRFFLQRNNKGLQSKAKNYDFHQNFASKDRHNYIFKGMKIPYNIVDLVNISSCLFLVYST